MVVPSTRCFLPLTSLGFLTHDFVGLEHAHDLTVCGNLEDEFLVVIGLLAPRFPTAAGSSSRWR
jgi:hypothetical protein